jgi:hypothetical protein
MFVNTKYLFSLLSLFLCLNLTAQFYNMPSEYFFDKLTQKNLAKKDSSIHESMQPYIPFFNQKYTFIEDTFRLFKFIVDDPAIDAVFNKHVIRIEPSKFDFKIKLDPIIGIETGANTATDSIVRLFTNTRGFIGSGQIGKNVYFESMFAENQSELPNYLNTYASVSQIIPGQGRWKGFKKNGYDFAYSSGFVSIQTTKNTNLQFGSGKHKIGNGYRSLFLSDNAFNYPYVKFTQQWLKGKLQYTNLYASLMNLDSASIHPTANAERLYQKKGASFQYLSYNLSKSIKLGLFQGMVWQPGGNKNQQNLTWEFFNPIIYFNTAYYGQTNKQNIISGTEIKIKATDKINFYSQFIINNLNSKHSGFQVGINIFDLFRVSNLNFTVEYNQVNSKTYQSSYQKTLSDSISLPYNKTMGYNAYTQYNQPLAYTPLYGNEFVALLDYRKNRFFVNLKFNNLTQNASINNNQTVQNTNFKIGYVINPAYNLNISLGANYRNNINSNVLISNLYTNYVYISFKSSLFNFYTDF